MGVVFKHRGSFKNLEKFLKDYDTRKLIRVLESYGEKGVRALSSATPVDSGLTASSWSYSTSISKGSFSIMWTNSNLTNTGTPIVILLQYGFATRGGGFVQGRDFINPSIQPVLDEINDAVWQEVWNL